MKLVRWALLLCMAAPCGAQTQCPSPADLFAAVSRVHRLQVELKSIQAPDMEVNVPPSASELLVLLKDALSSAADMEMACAGPPVDPANLEKRLARALHANPPEPQPGTTVSSDNHSFDEASGSYGHNLRVRVTRPANSSGILEINFSVNIECGNDQLLLVYTLQNGQWKRQLCWQAPPLTKISDAFGDMFLSTILAPSNKNSPLIAVVVHGMPWCTSRFSAFDIDVLSPTGNPKHPKVVWHTRRGYSRGDFVPELKSSGRTFEFRINESCMDINCYERHVIYRYRVDEDDRVHRIEPLATNARGFVEEWLSAPWPESKGFSAPEPTPALEEVHRQFVEPRLPQSVYVNHTYGPVRECADPGLFQVEIDSTMEKIVPGKPGGDSAPLPTYYFHVREIKNGYLMISVPTKLDPRCQGADLMETKPK